MKDRKKGFFSKMLDKLDGKLEKEAKEKSCCCKNSDSKDSKSKE